MRLNECHKGHTPRRSPSWCRCFTAAAAGLHRPYGTGTAPKRSGDRRQRTRPTGGRDRGAHAGRHEREHPALLVRGAGAGAAKHACDGSTRHGTSSGSRSRTVPCPGHRRHRIGGCHEEVRCICPKCYAQAHLNLINKRSLARYGLTLAGWKIAPTGAGTGRLDDST